MTTQLTYLGENGACGPYGYNMWKGHNDAPLYVPSYQIRVQVVELRKRGDETSTEGLRYNLEGYGVKMGDQRPMTATNSPTTHAT